MIYSGDTHHENVGEINQHDSIAVLATASDVKTDGSHRLRPATLNEIESHG